jgi:hypothetical protein
MTNEVRNEILRKMIKPKIEKDLKEIGEKLSLVVNEYRFLFEGSGREVMGSISSSYIDNYDDELNEFDFDFEKILINVPEHIKEEIFNNVLTSFSKTVTLDDIRKKD